MAVWNRVARDLLSEMVAIRKLSEGKESSRQISQAKRQPAWGLGAVIFKLLYILQNYC